MSGGIFLGSGLGGLAGACEQSINTGKWSYSRQSLEPFSVCRLTGGRGTALFSMSNTVSGVNSRCSCPEEGWCGRGMTEDEEDVDELQDEDGRDVKRSVKLCRAGGGGGGGGEGGGWDGGRL